MEGDEPVRLRLDFRWSQPVKIGRAGMRLMSQSAVNLPRAFAIVTFGLVVGSAFAAHAEPPTPSQEQEMIQKVLQQDDETYFDGCDGYGAARKSGDGMTVTALEVFGIHPMLEAKSGDTVRRTPQFGVTGIADCGAALSDLQRYPQFWMRKVSLLRARALHRFASGDTAGAEADLASAEASAVNPSDPFYARSLKLALAFEHAYFLSRTGRQSEAEAAAMAAWETRPYSRQTTYSAIVALGSGANTVALAKLNERLAALDPEGHGAPGFLLPEAPPDAALPSTPTTALDAEALYSVLPEPETSQRIAPAPADRAAPIDNRNPTLGADDRGGIVVSFYGDASTLSIAEEQSLLRAAISARQAGKRGFSVVRRRDVWHMRTKNIPTCGVYVRGVLGNAIANAVVSALAANNPDCNWTDTYTDGFESDLDIVFDDPTSAAAAGDDKAATVLDADAVYAALAPIYLTASPAAGPGKP